jgi:hypothetical protein
VVMRRGKIKLAKRDEPSLADHASVSGGQAEIVNATANRTATAIVQRQPVSLRYVMTCLRAIETYAGSMIGD